MQHSRKLKEGSQNKFKKNGKPHSKKLQEMVLPRSVQQPRGSLPTKEGNVDKKISDPIHKIGPQGTCIHE